MKTDARQNGILGAIPESELTRISPNLKAAKYSQGEPIYRAGEAIKAVYFPFTGVISVITTLSDGSSVEVSMIGCEGVCGTGALVAPESMHNYLCQAETDGLKIGVAALRSAVEQSPVFDRLIRAHEHAQFAESAQAAACNRLHEAEARMARWLLLVADRTSEDEFPMTHEFMSDMLGARRPTVSLVAHSLQQKKLIEYSRGCVRILDRRALENAACECYSMIVRAHQVFSMSFPRPS